MDKNLYNLFGQLIGFGSVFSYIFYKRIIKIIKYINKKIQFQKTIEQTPDMIYQQMKNFKNKTIMKNCIVSGQTIKYNQKNNNQLQDLIYLKQENEEVFTTLYKIFYGTKKITKQIHIPLFLLKGQDQSILVQRNNQVLIDDQLFELINTETQIKEIEPIYYIFYPIALFFKLFNIYRGFKIGFIKEDFGIKIDKILKIFGDVVIEDNQLKITNPMVYFLKKENYVQYLNNQINFNMQYLILFCLIFGFISYKYYVKIKNIIMMIKNNPPNQTDIKIAAIQQVETQNIKGFKCLNCNQNLRNQILVPCLHMNLCQNCINIDQCPQCLSNIKSIIQIFIP